MPCSNCKHFNAHYNNTTHDFEDWGECTYPPKMNYALASNLTPMPDAGSTCPQVSKHFSCGSWLEGTPYSSGVDG